MNVVFLPEQNKGRQLKLTQYDKLYFPCSENSANERLGPSANPQITHHSVKCQLECTMQICQFPVRPVFAVTIYESQDQIFDFIVVDQRISVFVYETI